MTLDERIADYKQKIEQEKNQALKNLYQVNLELLIKLKSENEKCFKLND